MKLEVGQYYMCRNGRIFGPMEYKEGYLRPFTAKQLGNRNIRASWTETGRIGFGEFDESHTAFDLLCKVELSNAYADEEVEQVKRQRDTAIRHIAEWCVAIDKVGSSWDDWDDYFKDAMYRKSELSDIRELLDQAIAQAEEKYK